MVGGRRVVVSRERRLKLEAGPEDPGPELRTGAGRASGADDFYISVTVCALWCNICVFFFSTFPSTIQSGFHLYGTQ